MQFAVFFNVFDNFNLKRPTISFPNEKYWYKEPKQLILSCVIETCAKNFAIKTLGMNTMHTVWCNFFLGWVVKDNILK